MDLPSKDETDEDLIRQNREFLEKSRKQQITPAAKLIRVGKRKPEISGADANSTPGPKENGTKHKSRFAESRSKKKKPGLVDNTVLKEAVLSDQRTSVLGPIVARNVPTLSPLINQWNPVYNPRGFPQAPELGLLNQPNIPPNESNSTNVPLKKKSLYMRQIEKERNAKNKEVQMKDNSSKEESTRIYDIEMEDKSSEKGDLNLLGDQSFILDGKSGLGKPEEAGKIHTESISYLSKMSHKERLNERNELLAQLNPDLVQFVQSLRQKKDILKTTSLETMEVEEGKTEPSSSLDQEMKDESPGSKVNSEQMEDGPQLEVSPVRDHVPPSQTKDKKSVRFGEEIALSELPIPPEEAKKWINMKKVELDKLKWMTDVPEPKPLKGKEGFVARFSFNGDLLPYDSDVSWREGLHHHGEEPGRAGYTLDELFMFVRSQVVQQRHLGLKTIAHILRNAKEGLYDTCFNTSILQLMVDAGIVLLLRFSIDETTALVYQEALRALYFLVSNEPDETCLSIAEPWSPLGLQPGVSSHTHSKEKDREELDAEEKELKDVEVIKLDMVRALVRMDVHIRLRYLLESVQLSPPDVVHILGILKRIARHSLTAAWSLVNTPRLIATITKHFLPHNTSPLLCGGNIDKLTSVYGVPLSQALSLMKVLASRGRQIATTLIEEQDLISRVMVYVSMEPTEVQMPITQVLSLAQEAYSLWAVFLSYGLAKSQQGFSTFYPLFVKQLIFYRDKVDINDKLEINQFNYEVGAHLANVLTKGLCVSATKSLLTNRMKNNESSVTTTDKKKVVLQPPILDWEEFGEILTLVEICLMKWANQLARSPNVSFSGLKLVGCFCEFLNHYLTKWRDQVSFDGVSFTSKVQLVYSKIILLLLKNSDILLKGVRNYSILCSTLKLGSSRDAFNLGSLWCICQDGEVNPIVQTQSPYPFWLPFTALLKTTVTLCPSLDAEPILQLLCHGRLTSYLEDVCTSSHSLSTQWFTRVEIHAICNILQLACLKGCKDYVLYHRTALTLMPLVHKGDEHIIKSLLADVVCNVDFIRDLSEVTMQINTLSVKDFKPLKSPAIAQPTISSSELTQRLIKLLPSIGQNLSKNLLHSRLLEKSLLRYNCIPFLVNDLSCERDVDVTVLDHYWCLSPLNMLLLLNDAKGDEASNQSEDEIISSVVNWLQMTYLLLKYRKSVSVTHTNPTGWFRHLSNVFLASNDLFLDASVNSYIQASLSVLLSDQAFKELSWSVTFPDLLPCFDWFTRMVEHYSAVSYGDSCFALFLIVPLMRKWPVDYKLLLFGDNSAALPFIRLTMEEVTQFIPLESFVSPPEDDDNVITKYKSAVGGKVVTSNRNPFLYQLLSYHISQFENLKKT